METVLHGMKTASLSSQVHDETGVLAIKCYQCGKCSAGCPVVDEMDFAPSMVMRMLQTGDEAEAEKLLRSMSIWLCVTCEMCVARCPMEIDIPKVMDFLRQKSLNENKANPRARKIIAFHKSFLDSINFTGRLYEMGLIVDYKMRTGDLLQDVTVAPKMFLKGKLNPFPELIKGRKNMSEIFKRTKKNKEGLK
jgi:heterodisulfide reductase subunit C2